MAVNTTLRDPLTRNFKDNFEAIEEEIEKIEAQERAFAEQSMPSPAPLPAVSPSDRAPDRIELGKMTS